MNIRLIYILLACVACTYDYGYVFASKEDFKDVMVELAHSKKSFRNVGMLKARIPLPFGYEVSIFSGSCVYMGDGVAITNAHCLSPFYWFGKFRLPMSISIEEVKSFSKKRDYKVTEILPHPSYTFSWFSPREKGFDLALLRLEKSIPDLEGLNPSYSLPLKKLGKLVPIEGRMNSYELKYESEEERTEDQKIYAYQGKIVTYVGYGTNGTIRSWLSRNDKEKRASNAMVSGLATKSADDSTLFKLHTMLGGTLKLSNAGITLEQRSLIETEEGMRYGMSGGATFLDDEFVALNASSGTIFKTVLTKMKRIYQNYFGKYMTALGIPMPFMNPSIGQVGGSINLSVHKDWIENTKKKWQ